MSRHPTGLHRGKLDFPGRWDFLGWVLAERVGFEPTIRLRVFRFSRPARSTAPSPLRVGGFYQRGGSTRRFDGLESAHIRLQRHRDVHAAIGALIVLHDRSAYVR